MPENDPKNKQQQQSTGIDINEIIKGANMYEGNQNPTYQNTNAPQQQQSPVVPDGGLNSALKNKPGINPAYKNFKPKQQQPKSETNPLEYDFGFDPNSLLKQKSETTQKQTAPQTQNAAASQFRANEIMAQPDIQKSELTAETQAANNQIVSDFESIVLEYGVGNDAFQRFTDYLMRTQKMAPADAENLANLTFAKVNSPDRVELTKSDITPEQFILNQDAQNQFAIADYLQQVDQRLAKLNYTGVNAAGAAKQEQVKNFQQQEFTPGVFDNGYMTTDKVREMVDLIPQMGDAANMDAITMAKIHAANRIDQLNVDQATKDNYKKIADAKLNEMDPLMATEWILRDRLIEIKTALSIPRNEIFSNPELVKQRLDQAGLPDGDAIFAELQSIGTGLRQIEKTREIQNAPKRGEESVGDFFQYFADNGEEALADALTLGLYGYGETKNIQSLIERGTGPNASDSDKAALMAYIFKDEAQQNTSLSWVYNTGDAVSEMVPFMLTFGAGRGIAKGLSRGATEYVIKQVGKITTKILPRVAGTVTEASIEGAFYSAVSPQFLESYAQRQIKDIEFTTDASGNITADFSKVEDPITSAYKAGVSTWLEFSTEGVGELFTGGRKLVMSEINRRIGKDIMSKSGDELVSFISKAKKDLRYDGFLGEYGEELVNGIAAPILTGEGDVSDFFKEENQYQLITSILLVDGAFKTAESVANGVSKIQNAENKRSFIKAGDALNSIFGEDQAKEIQSILLIDNLDERKKELIDNGYLTPEGNFDINAGNKIDSPEKAQALIDYMKAQAEYGASNSFETEQVSGELSKVVNKETGNVIIAEDAEGNNFFVTKRSMNSVLVVNMDTGQPQWRSASAIRILSETPADQFASQYVQQQEAEVETQLAQQEAAQQTPPAEQQPAPEQQQPLYVPQLRDKHTIEGKDYYVSQVGDGMVQLTPVENTDGLTPPLTVPVQQLSDMVAAQQQPVVETPVNTEATQATTEGVVPTTEGVVPTTEATIGNNEVSPQEQQPVPEQQKPVIRQLHSVDGKTTFDFTIDQSNNAVSNTTVASQKEAEKIISKLAEAYEGKLNFAFENISDPNDPWAANEFRIIATPIQKQVEQPAAQQEQAPVPEQQAPEVEQQPIEQPSETLTPTAENLDTPAETLTPQQKTPAPETVQPEVVAPEAEVAPVVETPKNTSSPEEIAQQEAVTNTNPTDGQKEAGNYKKGRIEVQGLNIAIENPKGSERSGVDESGEPWSITMNNTYGYFERSKGKDGDQVDLFLGDNLDSPNVFVIDQLNQDGTFDEHKVMLGFNTQEEAVDAYMSNYNEGWTGFGAVSEMDIEEFKQWLGDGKRTHLPLSWSPDIDHTTTESEWIDAVIKYSADPTTVFQAWQIETDNLPYNSLLPWQQAIVDGGYRTTPESFARWGDKSEVGKTFAILFYPNKKRGGTPIDTIAQELGMEGTPEECSMIADFMVQVSRNEYKNSDRRKALTEKFRMLTGYFPSQYELLSNKSNLDRIKAFLKKHGADKSLTFAEQLESIKEKLSQYQYEALKQYIFASRNGQIETPLLQTSETHSDSGLEYTPETPQDQQDDSGTRSGSDEAEGGEDLGEWATPFSVADNNLSPQSRERLGQIDKELAAASVRLRNAKKERDKHANELQKRVNLFGVDNEGPANQISMFDNIESNTTSENFQAAMEPYNRRVSEAKAYLENLEKVRAEIIRTDGNNLTLFRSSNLEMLIAEAEADMAWHTIIGSVVKKLGKELGGIPVRVISNIDALDENTKYALKKARKADPMFKGVKGYYDPTSNSVVIIPSYIRDIDDAKKTLIHEAVGHFGLRQMLGDKFDSAMLSIFKNMTLSDIESIVNINKGYYGDTRINEDAASKETDVERRQAYDKLSDEKKIVIADEFLAYSFEDLMNGNAPTWLQTIWAEIKQLIREFYHANAIPFTSNDLRVLAEKSKQSLIRGAAKVSAENGVPAFSMSGLKAIANMDNAIDAKEAYQKALIMEKDEATPVQIRVATGWEKGIDGKWFYEFYDSNVKLKKPIGQIINELIVDIPDPTAGPKVVRLSDIIDAPDHFKLYPDIANMTVKAEYKPSVVAAFDPYENSFYINTVIKDPEIARSALIHEMQHAIQEIEGFAPGASYQYKDVLLKSATKEITDLKAKLLGKLKIKKPTPADLRDIDDLNAAIHALRMTANRVMYMGSWNAYSQSLGEVNARNVQFRDRMRNEQIKKLISEGVEPAEAVRRTEERMREIPFAQSQTMYGMEDPVAPEDVLFLNTQLETGDVAMYANNDSIPETINIDGVDRSTRNSNGQILHSSEEGIRNFYKWFGESKVVDEQGRPLVVYHGTNIKDINEFYNGWFSEQKDVAVDFGQYIYPSYLKIENPIDDSDMEEIYKRVTGSEYDDMENSFALRDWIVSQANSYTVPDAIVGYDGVITYDDSNGIDAMAYVPFASNQIKSATENTGSFSPSNSDIRFRKADPIPNLSEAVINLEKQLSDKHKVGLDISYRPQTNSIYLSRIVVPKEMRGTGIGSGVMLDLIDFADNNGLRITLSPSTDFGATSKQRLVDFYKKHGFIQNKGRNADYSISESMYREPRVDATPQQSEPMSETINVDGIDRPTKTSKGTPIFGSERGIANFWRWFGNSKVVDDAGRPIVNYSGHSNISLYGDKFDPKKSTAGGFYATEDPQVASGYALSKFGSKEGYEHGSQYRLKGKNGKFNKKLWQIELTDEQKKKIDELAELTDEYGEHVYEIRGMRQWAKEMQRYEPLARRLLYQPYNLQNIWEFNESMGYNIAYDKQRTEANEPHFLLQQKNETERLLDALGIEWNSYEWDKPGIMPVFLSIKKPLDADYDFPQDVLDALKQAAKGEHSRSMDEVSYSTWTKDYPLKEFIADIERGSEGWTTQVPKKALPIFRRFGYDGIKERGQKGSDAPREERSINWIAFDPTQIKSATGNNGNFNPDKPEIMFRMSDPSATYTSDGKQLDMFSLMNQPEQESSKTDKRNNNPTLRSLEPGEVALVERKYRTDRNFKFYAPEKIESTQDVAYIFKNLEDYSVENAFAVYVKNGKAVVQHIGMGTFASTQLEMSAVVDGANRFEADEIYFVHNHPSGNLMASDADIRLLRLLKRNFGDKFKDAIIINLDSGKYATFDTSAYTSVRDHSEKPENQAKINVVSFTRQVFNKDYSFDNNVIRSSDDIAMFISSHRLGKRNKLSLLVLKTNLEITANIFLPYSVVDDSNVKEVSSEISQYVSRFGGVGAIIYGRTEPIKSSVTDDIKSNLSNTGQQLMDVIRIESDKSYSNSASYSASLPNGVMFRASDSPRIPKNQKIVRGTGNKLRMLFGDRMQPVKLLQNEILRRGGKIDSFTNVYDQENKSRSRAMARIEKTREKFLEPIENKIVEIMKANRAVKFEDIEKYLIAKHAPERNEYYRIQNKDKNPDAVYAGGIILPADHPIRVRYFEQEMANRVDQQTSPEEYLRLEKELNDKLDFDGVPMRDDIANEIAAEYESMFGKDKAKELSEAVHNMNKHILDLYLEYGAINEKQHEELSTRWNNYVPLRGWREDGKDIFDWQQSRGGNMNMLKSAEGRISEADSPLAYMENMMMSAIVWGEDNKVKQSFLNMARNNMDYKEGLFDLKKVWYITTDAIDAETGKNKVIATTVKPPQELFDADMVSTTVTSDYKSHLPATLANQRLIEVVENGEKYEIITNDPAVANAVNHNNDMWQDASRVSQRTIGKVTRFMSSLMTSKNPAFIIPNLTRDFAYAWISNASGNQGTSFVFNMRRASGAITRAMKGKSAPEKWDGVSRNKYYYDKLYADFIAGGGRTGFLRSMELDKIKAQIEKDIELLSRPLKPRSAAIRVGRFLNSTLDYMAGWSEDMSRFATYIASVRTGKSESEAINDAKNVTVNFDRKGQLTSFLGAMYAFFNPAVQGGLNFMGLAKKNKKAITAASVSFFALGYIMGALNRMVGGDDEFGNYYEALNPYLRKNYLIIPTFWDSDDKKFVSIPLPPVFRSFYGMGEQLHDVVNGNKSVGGYVAGSLSDFANSFSPFEPSQLITEKGGITIRPLVPTGLQPMFDIWITGKDFAGNDIRNTGFTKKIDELTPNSMQAKKNTGEVYQWISDRLFELGGGDPKIKSLLSIDKDGQVSKVPAVMDWNPSNIEYLMESYLGGRGQFFNQLAKTTDAVISGAVKYARGEQDGVFTEVNANTVPIINRFVRQPWKSQYVDRYWQLFTRYEEIENYEKAQFDAWYQENADKFPGLDPSKRTDKKSLMSHFEVDVDLKVNPFFMDDMKEAVKTLKDVTDEEERLRIMREISEKYFDQIIKQQKQ